MRELAYNSWKAMMARCYSESHKHYSYYGAKGISVCEEWHDFDAFYSDMGNRSKGMSLDRVNNDKGYSKDNCRWATAKEQANNRSNNTVLEMDGVSKTLSQWADYIGCSPETLGQRLSMGWSVKDTLTKPICKNNEITFNGVTMNLSQWAKKSGIAYTTIVSRFKKGLMPEEILKGAEA